MYSAGWFSAVAYGDYFLYQHGADINHIRHHIFIQYTQQQEHTFLVLCFVFHYYHSGCIHVIRFSIFFRVASLTTELKILRNVFWYAKRTFQMFKIIFPKNALAYRRQVVNPRQQHCQDNQLQMIKSMRWCGTHHLERTRTTNVIFFLYKYRFIQSNM